MYHPFSDVSAGLTRLNCARHGPDDDDNMSLKGKGKGKASAPSPSQYNENQWPPYPPPGETDLEKALRVEEEREARRVSDAIDRAIESERQAVRRRQKEETRLLLLGQSESGKSTMLKNFQLAFTPKALQAESDAWRAVIHLNLVRSVNFIIDLLSNAVASNSSPYGSSYLPHGNGHAGDTSPTVSSFAHRRLSASQQPSAEIRRYKLALSPLRQVEMILAKQLSVHDAGSQGTLPSALLSARALEVSVRGGRGWKSLLRRRAHEDVPTSNYPEELENARQILDACRADIVSLWASSGVQIGLKEEGVVLQEQSGFFLDQAARIADINYEPTFDDILKARLQTVGVEEHRLVMETAAETGQQWVFYDVGGARGQRASWVPFFDDVNAIIFLCSTAGFNEVLLEDRTVNRLLDSFNLWKTVCSSKMLGSTQFILLLNKTDILEARLKAGIQFSNYVKSYRDENDLPHVTDYLRKKFIAMHHHHSPQPRQLHVHSTCAIDIDTTSAVLMRIRDAILVTNLIATDML
ncbi:G-alpha-domain-containing protein [Lentinus tigrinus ALCF2SS1-7]|uniref:G-alpha-domain-containing protein n=1 Tax=Lentinus tigrinus ALCF2SS1-6 TaxID=1328759 RepID=A0A5C2SPC4_9APHY|nr:G-alpha-domain-containing protein [Lentinus tigrinus ALCF2SS1-6]RPD78919.1 G-alpha-domain-containing protein [Lentinus tigrinus ALCF2SS1-7]